MSAMQVLSGVVQCLAHPIRALLLVAFLLRHTINSPSHFFFRGVTLIPSAMQCLKWIREDTPDVVHLFWGHFPSLVGRLVQKYMPNTTVSLFLGAYDLEYQFGPTAPVARRAQALWTHARANLPAIAALGIDETRFEVVHRGIVVAESDVKTSTKKPNTIVSAGRLVEAKAFDVLLRVFARVRADIPTAKLSIAGDGDRRHALESIASDLGVGDAVEFLGHVRQKTLFELLEESEVFLLMSASASERLPNVIKEASLRRCATVTTASPGIDELVTDKTDGFVVQQGDVDAAATRVIELFKNAGRRDDMANAAYQRVVSSFDVDKSMTTYAERWTSLCSTEEVV